MMGGVPGGGRGAFGALASRYRKWEPLIMTVNGQHLLVLDVCIYIYCVYLFIFFYLSIYLFIMDIICQWEPKIVDIFRMWTPKINGKQLDIVVTGVRNVTTQLITTIIVNGHHFLMVKWTLYDVNDTNVGTLWWFNVATGDYSPNSTYLECWWTPSQWFVTGYISNWGYDPQV